MSALDDVIDHFGELYVNTFLINHARAELAQLREKAAKWDKLQADVDAGVVVLEIPDASEQTGGINERIR